ncbi:MAG TPA: glucose-6-phosphate isomerase, partial [Chitinophaga sp.]
MFPSTNPTTTKAWQQLQQHAAGMKQVHMRKLFADDAQRFEKFSLRFEDILFDYSKNLITEETRALLLELARECQVEAAIKAMLGAEKINATENRAVLHTALRNTGGTPVMFDGQDVMSDVNEVLKKMEQYCKKIHTGELRGYTGKPIRYIVNIGIGGSDLGPVMVTEALRPYWVKGMQPYFVSNVDGTHIAETLKKVTPEETLFLVASKTFTTQETMTNALTARQWFLEQAK